MKTLETVKYGSKEYPVLFRQTRKWSHTGMNKKGMVLHATTSNSFKGGLSWLVDGWNGKTYGNGGSAMFIVGRNVGEIAMLGLLNQMLWHAGRILNPSNLFKKLAVMKESGGYVNPNLYLDGIEFVGGVDEDRSGKVESDEINLTEWQYTCGEQIIRWHSHACGYVDTPETTITHEDIYASKPELEFVREELMFRLYEKKESDQIVCGALQEQNIKQQSIINQLMGMVKILIGLLSKK